ncbi:hypothetical protein VFPPC_17992 [Pochonia chlamydosporia 170]|uniref:Uncharacterized protein n=1 Tax=Pochonia chlamydosporia 170 TaxID=1380566 RepID=A0A219ARK7_METCM|nr:hypothetical protein VFPPC_17992 [Pochonia chlamydosporia 170]OWT42815.1 hypothetical protein VFPPC_17992 [Pochonia chlamydosporia 170]
MSVVEVLMSEGPTNSPSRHLGGHHTAPRSQLLCNNTVIMSTGTGTVLQLNIINCNVTNKRDAACFVFSIYYPVQALLSVYEKRCGVLNGRPCDSVDHRGSTALAGSDLPLRNKGFKV